MATIIQAGTATSGAVVSSDTSGNLSLVTGSSSQYTTTVPNTGGTVMVSGNMPAFSAYQSSSQSISNSTFTKIQLQTKEFDTNSNFDNTTNYRFTPTVAGYYQVSCNINWNFAGSGAIGLSSIYKNGTEFKRCGEIISNGTNVQASGSALVYMNGSTDYIEMYGFQNSGSSQPPTTGQALTYFQAAMIRTA